MFSAFNRSFTNLFVKCNPLSECISPIAPNCNIMSMRNATVDFESACLYDFAMAYFVVAHVPTKMYEYPLLGALYNL